MVRLQDGLVVEVDEGHLDQSNNNNFKMYPGKGTKNC